MRKDSGFEVTDRIDIAYQCDDDLNRSIEKFADEIRSETLADTLERKNVDINSIELNDKSIAVEVKRK